MADFGALEAFLDDVDVKFEFAGKQYAVTFPFQRVAAFKAHQAKYRERLQEGDVKPAEQATNIYTSAALLFGGKFDTQKYEFTGLPKDHFIRQMIEDGASFTVIDRVVSGIWAKFEWNDDVAEQFIETYDLGKALAAVIEKAKNESKSSPEDNGETGEDDSVAETG